MIINQLQFLLVSSYNQPKFSACATWNPNAITFANSTTVGTTPLGLHVDTNNTVYVAASSLNRVPIWIEGNMSPVRNISTALTSPNAVVASINGDVYINNGAVSRRVDKWSLNATAAVTVMNTTSRCRSLFIDQQQNLYCSNDGEHKVVKISLTSGANTATLAAGNGTRGSAADLLSSPNGIFVDKQFSLYVADYGNNRIQLFRPGQLNATTVVGSSAPGTITLNGPTAVILDADNYLFISDHKSHRIIRSGPSGFHCLFGCSGVAGAAANQLNHSFTLRFDSYGNLFVSDTSNSRIQKFLLATNSCVPSYNQPKFSSCATWDPNATTIANVGVLGTQLTDVFVDINNTIYVPTTSLNRVQVWLEENTTVTRTISAGLNAPHSVFVTLNGDIYIDNNAANRRVDVWAPNATASVVAMNISGTCYGIFIDMNEYLYCSTEPPHQVIKNSLHNDAKKSIIVAGNGTAGNTSYMLRNPRGIVVDSNFNLYVADCGNNRIQLFRLGELNGATIAISGLNGLYTLNCPSKVVLDIDGYLFITDTHNNRILGSGPLGFRCIVGCTGTFGSAPNQLYSPHALSFDSHGSLFVIEYGNNRLQKFFLASNSCVETSTAAASTLVLETSTNAISYPPGIQSLSFWFPTACPTSNYTGSSCNISALPCDILKPCQNNGTCINNNTIVHGYICLCLPGFNGTQCQFDHRPCQPNTCWNNGTCQETSNTTFSCTCATGWQDNHCQTQINYCENITCLNNGVCRPSLLNYTCLCLGDSYSGRHCEKTAKKRIVLQIVSRSFGSVAIIAMISVAIIVMTMDVLKYCFGIDPTGPTRAKLQAAKRKRHKKKRKKPPTIIRYTYVNAPPQQPIATIEETAV